MNRYKFTDPKEELIEITDSFVFKKGQVLKEKELEDEYVLILDIGEHVNEWAGGGEETFDIEFITCDARGIPFRTSGKYGISGERYWQKYKMKDAYWYTNKTMVSEFLEKYRSKYDNERFKMEIIDSKK